VRLLHNLHLLLDLPESNPLARCDFSSYPKTHPDVLSAGAIRVGKAWYALIINAHASPCSQTASSEQNSIPASARFEVRNRSSVSNASTAD